MSDHQLDAVPVSVPTQSVRGEVGRAARTEIIVLEAYDRHQRDLYGFARALVRDPEAAEDVVAEAFARLCREVAAGRIPADPRAWLFRVVANLVVTGGRRMAVLARILPFIGRSAQQDDPVDAGLLRSEVRADLQAALELLHPAARSALLLAAEGFSGREIAHAIGRSEAATRTLMCRARLRVREALEGPEVRG